MGNYQKRFKTRLGSTVKITETFVFPEINDYGHFLLSSLQKAGFSIEFQGLTWFQKYKGEVDSDYYEFNITHKKKNKIYFDWGYFGTWDYEKSSLIWDKEGLFFYYNWSDKIRYADEIIPVNSETLDYILSLFNCNLVKREYKVKYTFYEKLGQLKPRTNKMKPYGYKSFDKSNNDLKGKWSRMEKANFERKFKKKTRRELKVNPADYYELDEQFSTLDNYR